jgi:hypothetical protein
MPRLSHEEKHTPEQRTCPHCQVLYKSILAVNYHVKNRVCLRREKRAQAKAPPHEKSVYREVWKGLGFKRKGRTREKEREKERKTETEGK